MTSRNISALLLLFVFIFSGCQGTGAPSPTPSTVVTASQKPSPEPPPSPTPTPELDPIAQQLAAMTVEQKVGQLLVAGFEGTEAGQDAKTLITEYQVGGLILFGRNVQSAEQLLTLTNHLKALNGTYTPLFLCIDQEGGVVDRMPPEVHRTPSAFSVGQAGDVPARALLYGRALGSLCAAFGLNTDFAPVADIWSNPNNTVIGRRAFGTDADIVSAGVIAATDGLQERGIIPVAKHFPGHGDTDVDSHVGLPVVTKSLEAWEQFELLPFRTLMEASSPPCLMVGHILLTALDDAYPATLSRPVVTGYLREEQGYTGTIFTDDMTMGAITQTYGLGEAVVLAVEAGCDGILVCHGADNIAAARTALLEAAASGRISPQRLDESVTRILQLKQDYALTNLPADAPDLAQLNAELDAILS